MGSKLETSTIRGYVYRNHPSKHILESSYFLAYLCGKK